MDVNVADRKMLMTKVGSLVPGSRQHYVEVRLGYNLRVCIAEVPLGRQLSQDQQSQPRNVELVDNEPVCIEIAGAWYKLC